MDTLERIESLAAVIKAREGLVETRNELMLKARSEGISWIEIARAAGMDAQSARMIAQHAKGKK